MPYAVYDNEMPANSKIHTILKDPCWETHVFDTYLEAVQYADKWLGQYSPGTQILLEKLNYGEKYDYDGYGDTIEIRKL